MALSKIGEYTGTNSAGSAAYHSQVNVDPKQSNMINLINN